MDFFHGSFVLFLMGEKKLLDFSLVGYRYFFSRRPRCSVKLFGASKIIPVWQYSVDTANFYDYDVDIVDFGGGFW